MQRWWVAAVLLLTAPSLSSALVQAYSVEPVKASWSGKADPDPDGSFGDTILNSPVRLDAERVHDPD